MSKQRLRLLHLQGVLLLPTSEVLQGCSGALVLAVEQKEARGLLGKEHEDEVEDERDDAEAGQPAPGGHHRAQHIGVHHTDGHH